MRSLVAPLLFASLAACTSSRSAGPTATAQTQTESASAHEALPFIEDDYGRAVSEAKAKKLPIFVDVWAPW